ENESAQARLDGCLAVAEEIVDSPNPRIEILVAVPRRFSEREIPVGHQRARPQRLRREVRAEVVEAKTAIEREPPDGPPVLDLNAQFTVQLIVVVVRRGALRN